MRRSPCCASGGLCRRDGCLAVYEFHMSPFALRALPAWLQAMVETCAASTQVDPTMPVMMALGVLSATLARKGLVVMPSGRTCPLHLWIGVVAEAGGNKSSTMNLMDAPLRRVRFCTTPT